MSCEHDRVWIVIPTAALAVVLLAPRVQAALWGVTFGDLPIVVAARVGFISGTVGFVAGAATFALLSQLSLSLMQGSSAAGCAVLIAGLGFAWFVSRRHADARGVTLLALRLGKDPSRFAQLDRVLADAGSRLPAPEYARLVLTSVNAITAAGHWEAAERHLSQVDSAALSGEHRALLAQARATCLLELGRVDDAQDALLSLPRPTPDARVERWLITCEALIAAVRGDSTRALNMLELGGPSTDPSLLASRRVVRAHAYAARKEQAQLQAELDELVKVAGAAGLQRVTKPEGPASAKATKMLAALDQT